MPSLNPEIVAGENNEMNFMIIRFSATEGNCSVQSLSLSLSLSLFRVISRYLLLVFSLRF